MEKNIDKYLDEIFKFNIENFEALQIFDAANQFSPLVLAYIGDAIYELIIRTLTLKKGNRAVNKLHKDSISLVKANTQAIFGKSIKDELSDEELIIYKRGRNAKSHSVAKNASISDYRYATAFEALLGYLYLNKRMDRIIYLIKKALILNNIMA